MIWAYAIDGLSPQQLAQGIKNLTRREGEFPPSAGQFRDLCLTDMDWEHNRIKEFKPLALEDGSAKERRKAAAQQGIAAIRAATGFL